MNFKQEIPKELRLVANFEDKGIFKFGDYTLMAFYPTKSEVYDLSFGNNTLDSKYYLSSTQITYAVYDNDSNFVAVLNHNNIRDCFEFNGTAVLVGADNIFYYFDLATKDFNEVKFDYPFKTGKGTTLLNEVTEDVAIITHNFYAKVPSSDLSAMYKGLVNEYNSRTKKRVKQLSAGRRSEYHQFDVNIMINKNFEVEAIERYWVLPKFNHGWLQYFPEYPEMNFTKVLVV